MPSGHLGEEGIQALRGPGGVVGDDARESGVLDLGGRGEVGGALPGGALVVIEDTGLAAHVAATGQRHHEGTGGDVPRVRVEVEGRIGPARRHVGETSAPLPSVRTDP